jgi:ClpP class serine protease
MLKDLIKNEKFLLDKKSMNNLIKLSNNNFEIIEDTSNSENQVILSQQDNLSIITLDGAMYKKSLANMCISVVSYPSIIKAIKLAEENKETDTIIFRVDTVGGHVAGVEELRDTIAKCDKKTITFYENIGASAGIYSFMEADEIYSAPLTKLGSIGVLVAIEESEDDNKTTYITSKNATNKVCTKNCDVKIKKELNEIEDMFFKVLKNNTNMSKETIIKEFNSGGTISSEKAKQIGFIKDVLSFNDLILQKKYKNNKNYDTIEKKGVNLSKEETKLTYEDFKSKYPEFHKMSKEEEHNRIMSILSEDIEPEASFIKQELIKDMSKTKEDIGRLYYENRKVIEANKKDNNRKEVLEKHSLETNKIVNSVGNPVGEDVSAKEAIEDKQAEAMREEGVNNMLVNIPTKPKEEF